MTFDDWWAAQNGMGANLPRAIALAAWDAAVERCARLAEETFRPADAWSRPCIFGGAAASALYYRDAERHAAGREIATAIREGRTP